nr:hypothetical protein CFP56_09154 [Quercus suber]
MSSPSKLPSARRPTSRPLSMLSASISSSKSSDPISDTTEPAIATFTSKISKRRSLLPQFSRNTSSEEKGKQIGLEEETSKWTNKSGSIAEEPGRTAMGELERKAMPPPASTIISSRPTSMYSTSSLGRKPSKSLHTRAPSNASADPVKKLTGGGHAIPERTGSLSHRPTTSRGQEQASALRGLTRTPSVQAKASDARARTSSTSTVKSTTSNSEKRSSVAVGHGRQPSIATSQTSGKSSPPHRPSSTSPRQPTGVAVRSQMPGLARPQFNTFQQHYSPAKSALPKPPIPSVRASKAMPSSLPPDEEMAGDMSRVQIELLQLSLLHQVSLVAAREYDASAKRKLGRRHAKLKNDYEDIRAAELEHRRHINFVALNAWCSDQALLVESLHVLSRVHTTLANLLEPDSRYSDLVATFAAWIDDADSAYDGVRPGFASSLPEVWRQTHTSLALKLRALHRELDSLPPAPREWERGETSSLAALLGDCRTLLEGMLKELEVMVKLEKETVQRERAKVEAEVEALALEPSTKSTWLPAWQTAQS